MEKNEISGPFIKLDQLLKFSGIAGDGGHAKALIAEGMVFVNGEAETRRGRKIKDGDFVTVGEHGLHVHSKN